MVKYDFKNNKYWYDENKIWEDTLNEKEFEDKCKLVMGSNIYKKMKNDTSAFGFDAGYDEKRLDELMDLLPKAIYSNIVEWINGDTLTDIKIKDVSLKEIVEYYNLDKFEIKAEYDYTFYKLLHLMGEYNNGKYKTKKQVFSSAFGRIYRY